MHGMAFTLLKLTCHKVESWYYDCNILACSPVSPTQQ